MPPRPQTRSGGATPKGAPPMRTQPTTPLLYATNRGTVCIADGYRVTVRVRHGRLIVEDGFGPERRRREYTRVTEPLSRLVVVGNGGSVSLEALCWLRDVGAALVHVARDGRLIATTTPDTADAKLRRAQARAAGTSVGIEVARFILRAKLDGQRRVLRQVTGAHDLAAAFERAATSLEAAATVEELVWAERDAALAYWTGWSAVEMRFAVSDVQRLPEQWLRFAQRGSPLTASPRLAVNPANAILNYLYTLLEAEARLACLAVGLDPTVGIVHADYRSRDSLALDLMEAVRPDVDAYALGLLRQRTFRANEFLETRTGVCRIQAPMTQQLGNTTHLWRRLLAPVAEALPGLLTSTMSPGPRPLPTPLTRANHTASRARAHSRQPRTPTPSPACKRCGGQLPNRRRVYCDACLPMFQQEQLEAGRARIAANRIVDPGGADTTHGGQAKKRRAASNVARKAQVREWEECHGKLVDLSSFDREILPLIQDTSLTRLVRATGLSLRYVSQIRRGEKRPHPRHWQALASVAGQDRA